MAERRPPAVVEAAASGDRVKTLAAVRDLLARALASPDIPAREVAAVAGRLQSVLAELAELTPPEVKGTALDELDSRRRARGADSAARKRSSGR